MADNANPGADMLSLLQFLMGAARDPAGQPIFPGESGGRTDSQNLAGTAANALGAIGGQPQQQPQQLSPNPWARYNNLAPAWAPTGQQGLYGFPNGLGGLYGLR